MSKKEGAVLSLQIHEEQVEAESSDGYEIDGAVDERQMYLKHGRKLAVASDGVQEVIEIRASSGALELRIKMTEEGPLLMLEGVKLAVKAEESIEMECKRFSVNASESVELASQQELKVSSEGELNIRSEAADVRVKGEKIFLN